MMRDAWSCILSVLQVALNNKLTLSPGSGSADPNKSGSHPDRKLLKMIHAIFPHACLYFRWRWTSRRWARWRMTLSIGSVSTDPNESGFHPDRKLWLKWFMQFFFKLVCTSGGAKQAGGEPDGEWHGSLAQGEGEALPQAGEVVTEETKTPSW